MSIIRSSLVCNTLSDYSTLYSSVGHRYRPLTSLTREFFSDKGIQWVFISPSQFLRTEATLGLLSIASDATTSCAVKYPMKIDAQHGK